MELRGLTHQYSGEAGVWDISGRFAAGKMSVLVGGNGSGKSTLINILGTLIRPHRGEATFNDESIFSDLPKWRGRLGLLPEAPELIEQLSGLDFVTHVGIMRGLKVAEARRRSVELAKILAYPADARPISQYSTGSRKKVGFASAMATRNDVIIMDEPLESVDPLAMEAMTHLLRQAADAGSTVLMSTHDLNFAATHGDQVAVMANGRLIETFGGGTNADVILQTMKRHSVSPGASKPSWWQ